MTKPSATPPREFVDLIEQLNVAWDYADYEKFLKSSKEISLALEEAKAEITELKRILNSRDHFQSKQIVEQFHEIQSLKDRLAIAVKTLRQITLMPILDPVTVYGMASTAKAALNQLRDAEK